MRARLGGMAAGMLAALVAGTAGGVEYEMTTYQFALLRDGPRRGEITGAEAEATQAAHLEFLSRLMRQGHVLTMGPPQDAAPLRGHLANIEAMAASGDLVIAGPMGDDTDLRGLLVFRTADEAAMRQMVARDPVIRAGRLELELIRWLLPAEALPPLP